MYLRRAFAVNDHDVLEVDVRLVPTSVGLCVVLRELPQAVVRGRLRQCFAQVANMYRGELVARGLAGALDGAQFVHVTPAWDNGRFSVPEAWHRVHMRRGDFGWCDPSWRPMAPDEVLALSEEQSSEQTLG
ncbi:hypothetical protein D3C71_21880 [compost metagenome]